MGVGPSRHDDFLYDNCECHGTGIADLQGFHRLSNREGAVLEAEFTNGKLEVGLWVSPKNDRFRGTFSDGRFHGQGKFEWADGRVFEGTFDKDCPVTGKMRHGDSEPAFEVLYDGVTPFFKLGAGTKLVPKESTHKQQDPEEWPPQTGIRVSRSAATPEPAENDFSEAPIKVASENNISAFLSKPRLGEHTLHLESPETARSVHRMPEAQEIRLEKQIVESELIQQVSVELSGSEQTRPRTQNRTSSPSVELDPDDDWRRLHDDWRQQDGEQSGQDLEEPEESFGETVQVAGAERCECHQTLARDLNGRHAVALSGAHYDGEWKRGRQSGFGKWKSDEEGRYEGQWKDGCFDGRGVFHFQNGEVLVGLFRAGGAVEGVVTRQDGSELEVTFHHDGDDGPTQVWVCNLEWAVHWKRASSKHRSIQQLASDPESEHTLPAKADNLKHSEGTRHGARGSGSLLSEGIAFGPAEGASVNSCVCHGTSQLELEGPHLVESAAGWRYIGQWLGGQRHGNGAWQSSAHGSYEGRWERGQMHGAGAFTWPNGDRFSGVMERGCPVRGELVSEGGARVEDVVASASASAGAETAAAEPVLSPHLTLCPQPDAVRGIAASASAIAAQTGSPSPSSPDPSGAMPPDDHDHDHDHDHNHNHNHHHHQPEQQQQQQQQQHGRDRHGQRAEPVPQAACDSASPVSVSEAANGAGESRCECHGQPVSGLQGWHELVESDGRRYAGEWAGGVWHGKGTWSNPLLGRYSGGWRQGVFHGRGVFRWERDALRREGFDGEFDQGCPCVGVLAMQGGAKFDVAYTGLTSILDATLTPVSQTAFKPSFCTCHGLEAAGLEEYHTVIEQDGRTYSGDWANGTWHGHGMWKNPALGEYDGNWSHGLFHGLGTLTWADGKVCFPNSTLRLTWDGMQMLHGNFEQGCPVSGILLDTDGGTLQVWYDGQRQAFDTDLTPIQTKEVRVDDPESWAAVVLSAQEEEQHSPSILADRTGMPGAQV